MKTFEPRETINGLFMMRRMALTAAVMVLCAGNALRAQAPTNISTAKEGATVIYSSPLSKGASPNSLINGQGGSISFSKKKAAGPHLIVIDLGKNYSLGGVRLNFSKSGPLKVFVLGNKPEGNGSWANAVSGAQPNGIIGSSGAPLSLNGAEGEYLVIVSDSDPGAFSGLYVTGEPSPFGRHVVENPHPGPNQLGSSSLSETPQPGSSFEQTPNVPPASN